MSKNASQITTSSRPRATALSTLWSAIPLAVLLAVGVIHWVAFLSLGNISFSVQDWPKELQYYSVLKQSLAERIIPYFVSGQVQGTDRFLALPETNLSPQVAMLRFMDAGTFVVANAVLLYVLGFIGCLLIRKRYSLSFLPFVALFLIFSFNGHITAHLAVGHSMWNGYFLLPFFCLFVLDLVDAKSAANTPLKIALVLFAIVLQGSFHIFLWCLMFLILLGAFRRDLLRPVLSATIWSFLLSSVRLIPAAVTFTGLKQHIFISGYPTLATLLNALVTIRDVTFTEIRLVFGELRWWEYDAFIGVIGLAFIAYFGLYLRFSKDEDLQSARYTALDAPIAAMTVLSLSYFYAPIAMLPIPFANAERVSSRFLVIPLLMLAVLACVRMEAVLRRIGPIAWVRVLGYVAALQLGFEFVSHSFTWSLYRIESQSPPATPMPPLHVIAPHDPGFVLIVKCSAVITLLCLTALVCAYSLNRLRTARSKAANT